MQDRGVVRSKYQSQRGDVLKMGLQMIRQPVNGLLFFRGEVRTCIGHDVSQTCARLHSDGLGFLPREFYVTFDDFITVGRCTSLGGTMTILVSFLKDGSIPIRVSRFFASYTDRSCINL